MDACVVHRLGFWSTFAQHLGLAFMLSGIFLERPALFGVSIILLLISTPFSKLVRRLAMFTIELLILACLIAVQLAASDSANALILTLYLIGLLNGLLLPHPSSVTPRCWFRFIAPLLVLSLFLSHIPNPSIGIFSGTSVFGANREEHQIDLRSLSYAIFIFFLYQTRHFQGTKRSVLHAALMLITASVAANKFGMLYSILYRLPPRIVTPLILLTYIGLTAIGIGNLGITSDRAELWLSFQSNFPYCDSAYGVCTELISHNNDEGVRSFHSVLLDFTWYGGIAGLLGGVFFLVRVIFISSGFGKSAAILFALSMLFGFPPFFNERHVFIFYALLILFPVSNRDFTHRAL